MSAFMCSDDHLRILAIASDSGCRVAHLVSWFQEYETYKADCGPDVRDKVREIERELLELYRENQRSLAFRYRELLSPDAPASTQDDPGPTITSADIKRLRPHIENPVTVLKLAQCYAYQACEHEGWKESKARTINDGAIARASQSLPGWNDAPWGL